MPAKPASTNGQAAGAPQKQPTSQSELQLKSKSKEDQPETHLKVQPQPEQEIKQEVQLENQPEVPQVLQATRSEAHSDVQPEVHSEGESKAQPEVQPPSEPEIRLPAECSLFILKMLDLKSRTKFRLVSKQWRSLVDEIKTDELIIHGLLPSNQLHRWFYSEQAISKHNVFGQFDLRTIGSLPFADCLKRLWIDYSAVDRCTIGVAVLNQFASLEQLTVNCLKYNEDDRLVLPNLIALDLQDAWTIARLVVDAPKLKALYANLDYVRVLDRRSLVHVRACAGMNGDAIDVYPSATYLRTDDALNFNLAVLHSKFPALQVCDLEQLRRTGLPSDGGYPTTYSELRATTEVIRTLKKITEMGWTSIEFRVADLSLDDEALDEHLRQYCGLPAKEPVP